MLKMPSSNQKLARTPTFNAVGLEIPQQICLSLATGPMLIGILGTKALTQWLQALGEASEEVFRGDRLPVLRVPHPDSSEQTVTDEKLI